MSYVESSAPPVIEVVAVNPGTLAGAELVAADGRVLKSAAIERETLPGTAAPPPTVGVGVFGGSSHGIEGTGIGIGFPFGGFGQPPPGPVRARARLAIDDIAAYRRDWRELVVRLRFGSAPGQVSLADIPAPQPR